METLEMLSEYELERGKPMPSINHGVIQARLIGAFLRYEDQYTVASELTLDLEPQPLIPDICVYPRFSLDLLHDQIKAQKLPLLVVEILSPRQYISDLIDKMELYFAAGVKSGWLVQPALSSIVIFTPEMESTVYSSGEMTDPVMGITVNLDKIFS